MNYLFVITVFVTVFIIDVFGDEQIEKSLYNNGIDFKGENGPNINENVEINEEADIMKLVDNPQLHNTNLKNEDGANADFKDEDGANADLKDEDGANADLKDENGANADFIDEDGANADLKDEDGENADLKDENGANADFKDEDGANADLEMANHVRPDLNNEIVVNDDKPWTNFNNGDGAIGDFKDESTANNADNSKADSNNQDDSIANLEDKIDQRIDLNLEAREDFKNEDASNTDIKIRKTFQTNLKNNVNTKAEEGVARHIISLVAGQLLQNLFYNQDAETAPSKNLEIPDAAMESSSHHFRSSAAARAMQTHMQEKHMDTSELRNIKEHTEENGGWFDMPTFLRKDTEKDIDVQIEAPSQKEYILKKSDNEYLFLEKSFYIFRILVVVFICGVAMSILCRSNYKRVRQYRMLKSNPRA